MRGGEEAEGREEGQLLHHHLEVAEGGAEASHHVRVRRVAVLVEEWLGRVLGLVEGGVKELELQTCGVKE